MIIRLTFPLISWLTWSVTGLGGYVTFNDFNVTPLQGDALKKFNGNLITILKWGSDFCPEKLLAISSNQDTDKDQSEGINIMQKVNFGRFLKCPKCLLFTEQKAYFKIHDIIVNQTFLLNRCIWFILSVSASLFVFSLIARTFEYHNMFSAIIYRKGLHYHYAANGINDLVFWFNALIDGYIRLHVLLDGCCDRWRIALCVACVGYIIRW